MKMKENFRFNFNKKISSSNHKNKIHEKNSHDKKENRQ